MSITTFSMRPTRGFDWSEDEDDDFDLEAHKAKADTKAPTLQELGPLQPAHTTIDKEVDYVVECMPASESAYHAVYKSPDLPAYPKLSKDNNGRYDYRVNWMVHKVINMRDCRKWYLHRPSGLRNVVNVWDEEKVIVPAVKPSLERIEEEDEDEMATETMEIVEQIVEDIAEDAVEPNLDDLMDDLIEDRIAQDATMIERPVTRRGFYDTFEEGLDHPGAPYYFSDEDDEVPTIERSISPFNFSDDGQDIPTIDRPESRLSFYNDDEEEHLECPVSQNDVSDEEENEEYKSMVSDDDSSDDYPTGPVDLWEDEDPKKIIVRLPVASDAGGLFGTWKKGDKVVVRLPPTVRVPKIRPVVPLVKIQPVVPLSKVQPVIRLPAIHPVVSLPKAIPQPLNEVLSDELEDVEAFDRDMAQVESPAEELGEVGAFDKDMELFGPALENADEKPIKANTDEGYSSNSTPEPSPKALAQDAENAATMDLASMREVEELSLLLLPKSSAEFDVDNEIGDANDEPREADNLITTSTLEQTTVVREDLFLLLPLPLSAELIIMNEIHNDNDGPLAAIDLAITQSEEVSTDETTEEYHSLLPALPDSPEPFNVEEIAITNDGPLEAIDLNITPAEQESDVVPSQVTTIEASCSDIKHLKRFPRIVDHVIGVVSTSYQLLSPMNWFYASAFVAGVISDAVRAIFRV